MEVGCIRGILQMRPGEIPVKLRSADLKNQTPRPHPPALPSQPLRTHPNDPCTSRYHKNHTLQAVSRVEPLMRTPKPLNLNRGLKQQTQIYYDPGYEYFSTWRA